MTNEMMNLMALLAEELGGAEEATSEAESPDHALESIAQHSMREAAKLHSQFQANIEGCMLNLAVAHIAASQVEVKPEQKVALVAAVTSKIETLDRDVLLPFFRELDDLIDQQFESFDEADDEAPAEDAA